MRLHGERVGAPEWGVWVATVSAGLAIAVLLAIFGGTRLKRLRAQLPQSGFTRKEMWLHTILAVLWAGCLGALVALLVQAHRDWPVPDMHRRLLFVPIVGLACATPWVALTWLCHQATRPYWQSHRGGVNAAQDATERSVPAQPSTPIPATTAAPDSPLSDKDAEIAVLQQIWGQIVSVALAFSVLVAVSIIPTGALRNLWLSQDLRAQDKIAKHLKLPGPLPSERLEASFPSTDVLLYGAMWAFVAGVVVIPLVFSWRVAAQSVVDEIYPANSQTANQPDMVTARAALESMLNLSSGILRNPLTVLTIATPLVTAALAAFVPEISG